MPLRIPTLDVIRQVEFARSYNWLIWFPEIASGPFAGWFPATSVSEPIGSLTSHSFEIGAHEYKIPKGHSAYNISVTFLDDKEHHLEEWIRLWIDTIAPREKNGVATLELAARKCHISKLTPEGEVLDTRRYDLYPEGEIVNEYSSDATAKQFTISFVVVGLTF